MIDKKPQTIHILGNGPSLSLFNRGDWSEDDLFVGCNFSNADLRPDYTVIMDAKPMMKLFEGYKLTIPAVISDRCTTYIEKDKGGWRKLPDNAITVIDMIEMTHDKGRKYPMNSGHHATQYAIEQNLSTVETVNLWGFDSFWTNDISSYSDNYFRGGMKPRNSEPVASCWKLYWDDLFVKYSNINFIIKGKQ
jgi:hypothetical protein